MSNTSELDKKNQMVEKERKRRHKKQRLTYLHTQESHENN